MTYFERNINSKSMKNVFHLYWLILCIIIVLPLSALPEGYKIKFRVKGLHDTTCMIANYYGNGTYVKDTLKVDASGNFTFIAKEDLQKGIYLVVITDKNYFEFIINRDKKFSMETELNDLYDKMTLKDTPENSLFYDYLAYNRNMFEKVMILEKKKEKIKDQKDSTRMINEQIVSLNSAMIKYKLELVKKYPDSFVAFFINAMKEPEIPEIPLLSNGRKDSTFAYRYFKSHFWDGTDFTDDRLLRTPIFHNKLKKYFDQVLIQNADTIIKETDLYIEKARPNAEMFKYMVWFATNHYETSEIMGFDRIFVHVIDIYYITGQASWTNKTVQENLIKKANRLRPILIGEKAPNMIMLDTNNHLVSMHNLNADYLILLFWDPDCGHCEQEIPKLKEFYDTYKEKYNLEVFSVCSDTSLVKWKKTIKKKEMNWINVDGPRSLSGNYHDQYDITTTPVIYILNKKKEIIAKNLRTDQISQFLKNYNQNPQKP
jgi:thiol-disulfide isomerase/thioredoxin